MTTEFKVIHDAPRLGLVVTLDTIDELHALLAALSQTQQSDQLGSHWKGEAQKLYSALLGLERQWDKLEKEQV